MNKIEKPQPKFPQVQLATWYFAALGAIGFGLWQLYEPLCPLGVGLLVWFDLTLGAFRK